MKKTATLLTIMFFAGFSAALAAEHGGTFTEAKEKAAGLKKPILVDFFTEW